MPAPLVGYADMVGQSGEGERMRSKTPCRRRGSCSLLIILLLLSAGRVIPARASADVESTPVQAPGRQVPRHGLEDRVRVLAKALDLDAKQQSELRKVLEDQREQVRKVWSDTSVPAAYRVSATEAIGDRTADRIRALLNEEQRKRYKPPRVSRDALAGSTPPDVEAWMAGGKAR